MHCVASHPNWPCASPRQQSQSGYKLLSLQKQRMAALHAAPFRCLLVPCACTMQPSVTMPASVVVQTSDAVHRRAIAPEYIEQF